MRGGAAMVVREVGRACYGGGDVTRDGGEKGTGAAGAWETAEGAARRRERAERTAEAGGSGERSGSAERRGSAEPPSPRRARAGGEPEADARTVAHRRAGSGEDTEADALEELGDEIARLAAHLHAGRARLLRLVARFDAREGWRAGGHRSCAHWLAFRTGMDLRTAREHVRVARKLEGLPRMRAAMGRGRLSFSQVRAVSRVATAETEADLLALAEGCPTATLERRVRAWKRAGRGEEAARERELHRARRLAVFPDEEGMVVVRGRLPAEVGAVLQRALEAAEDALYRRERAKEVGEGDRSAERSASGSAERRGSAEPPSPRQARAEASRRRADAMGLVAERALAAGSDAPISGTRAERYLVFLHVEPATLAADGEPGRSELADGTRLSAETARRLACDTGTVRVSRGGDGAVLDVGRKRRTVPPALRRALEVRDRGCRFPGCGLRFTEAHHLVHWADGGETSRENTLLLCRHHHRLLHVEGWSVEWWGERAVFRDPRDRFHTDLGWTASLPDEPADPDLGSDPAAAPVAALERENRRRGADPGPLDASARWKRERDVPDDVWFRAHEAGLAAAGPP